MFLSSLWTWHEHSISFPCFWSVVVQAFVSLVLFVCLLSFFCFELFCLFNNCVVVASTTAPPKPPTSATAPPEPSFHFVMAIKTISDWWAIYTTQFPTQNWKVLMSCGCSFTQKQHFGGLKKQAFENESPCKLKKKKKHLCHMLAQFVFSLQECVYAQTCSVSLQSVIAIY